MNNWMVMAGIEITRENPSRERCFRFNAVDLTEAQAKAEADRRNAAEQAAGHTNVTWFACPCNPDLSEYFK